MRAPLTPLQAFVRDAESANEPADRAASPLSRWLAIAQAADRLAIIPMGKRPEYLDRLVESVLPPRAGRPSQIEGDGRTPSDDLTRLAERFRLEIEDMERAGCYELALTTVSSICRLLVKGTVAGRLLATAHMGRVMRQMGDLAAAIVCYENVVEDAIRANDAAVASHGYIGLGNVALARGNRPAQREYYLKALANAPPGSMSEVSSHQGLMLVAIVQRKLADALLHGWKAHDLAPPESESRLEVLNNLAHAALESGFPEAAKSGFEYTLTRTSVGRLRMPAIGGAMRASAALGHHADADRLERLGRGETNGGAPKFDIARFYLRCAESWHALSAPQRRERCLDDAEKMADEFGFHEIRMQVEGLRRLTVSVATTETGDVPFHVPFEVDARDSMVVEGIGRLESLSV